MASSLITTEAEWLLNRPQAKIGQGAMAKSQEFSTISGASKGMELARQARLVVRQAFTGSLATLDLAGGYPFASLVTVAASQAGDALLLLSGLARHTKNIQENSKASLLLEAPLASGDPLAAARITLQGDIVKTPPEDACARFLARHPEAADYADFADFSYYKLQVSSAHFIAGFARIHSFDRSAVCLDEMSPEFAWDATKCATVSATHQAGLKTAWRRQVGSEPCEADLKIVSVDGDGLDVGNGEALQRLNFVTVVEPTTTDIEANLPELLGIQTGK